MEVFECTDCNYASNVKCNFDKHLTTEKHQRNIRNLPVIPVIPVIPEPIESTGLNCKHCDKFFSHKQSLQRHENHRCKGIKKLTKLEINLQAEVTDLQKLVQLLHLQLSQKDVLLDIKNDLIEKLQKYNELNIN
jgi:signal recognition particle GTPase